MTDREIAQRYIPAVHFDRAETIPVRAVGYTVFRTGTMSRSFPKRMVPVPPEAQFTVEYAYYFDYDIEHMYDLEHVWVVVGRDGEVLDVQGSYHGKYLNLLIPDFPGALGVEDGHMHVFCQPGKHAMLAGGIMTKLYPGWDACCRKAGGPVLIGNPFSAAWSPTGKDLFVPTPEDDRNSIRYLRENLSFEPTLDFSCVQAHEDLLMTWDAMYEKIPGWIAGECARLKNVFGEG